MSNKDPYDPVPLTLKYYLTGWTTLFVGYSLLDYNLRLLFKTLRWKIDSANVPEMYSVDYRPDPLIFDVWHNQRRYVKFIAQDVWAFVPRLYELVLGEGAVSRSRCQRTRGRRPGDPVPRHPIRSATSTTRSSLRASEETHQLVSLVSVYRGVHAVRRLGLGKSSLINAGLLPEAPRLGFDPERLRVQPRPARSSSSNGSRPRTTSADLLPSLLAPDEDSSSRIVLSTTRSRQRLREVCDIAPAADDL